MRFIQDTMNIQFTPAISFQAHPMKFRPTAIKLNHEESRYDEEQVSLVEIDLGNKDDIKALGKISNDWACAMLVGNIYSEAKEMSEIEDDLLDYRFFVLTSQKDNFENLDPDKILSICEVEESNDGNDAFVEYIEANPDCMLTVFPEYKRVGSALLDGLKYYYNKISLYSIPTEDVLDFYDRNDFKPKSAASKRCLEWSK